MRGNRWRRVILCCGLAAGLARCTAGWSQAAPSSPVLAGCGAEETQFTTSRGEVGDATPAEGPSQATVYVVELFNLRDKGRVNRPTIRVGLDGAWMGATQGFSYLRFAVAPGMRHLCSRWQSRVGSLSHQISLYNFEAEAGRTYYLLVKVLVEGEANIASIDLQPVSADEGRFLVSQASRSISTPK